MIDEEGGDIGRKKYRQGDGEVYGDQLFEEDE